MIERHSVDLMYLACNRLEFTQETFTNLLVNTDWDFVHRLFVYDDGSSDGTREWLESNHTKAPVPTRLLKTHFGSPVKAMVHFIESAEAPILAKTDNDAMLPPSWLRQGLEVLDRHPELSLLGIEAMYPHDHEVHCWRSYQAAEFISGLGLYRRSAFAKSRPRAYEKWFGLEEWQVAQGARLTRGWIHPALPVFLLDRIPFEPWKSHSEAYIRKGWQRVWPKYDASCSLWQWWQPHSTSSAKPLMKERPRFLCAMRIKNEARHIHEVISAVLPLCERVLIFDDHSTDDTPQICESFGERVTVFRSLFEGLDEARDKNFLLQKIIEAKPEWVLWIDGDEVLESSGPAKLKNAAENSPGVSCYSLRIAYLWQDTHHVRVDGIFGRFHRPSFFRLHGQPVHQLQFPVSGFGGNFHCGNVPRGLTGATSVLEVRLKHYGYMMPSQRQAKYEWYNRVDPNNELEDRYRHLAESPGARHAPGPPQIIPWTE